MPRSSTLVILIASLALTLFGFAAALPAGIAMALALELVVWKAEVDRQRELQLARVTRSARPMRNQRRR
ncbi:MULTISPECIES: hypothetical protein [unclassified Massilia]|uniref:hypothetical protein n=1 Tax=Massilia TaxID=149698 RepID=UPI0025B72FA8|nr:hypothetical protein [Massilia sp. YIM B02763]MDN4056419.1 hypothetical protein [Massilia sp. YIM B02763]